jgi:hypothetical protein
MKILHLRDKTIYSLDNDIAEKIILAINELKFIKLPNGDLINTTEIIKITEPEKKAYFMGNEMTRDLKYVWKEGQKIPFNNMYKDRIKWKEQLPESINNKLLN